MAKGIALYTIQTVKQTCSLIPNAIASTYFNLNAVIKTRFNSAVRFALNLPIFIRIHLRSRVIILVTLTLESVFNPVSENSLSDAAIMNSFALKLLTF